MGVSSRSSADKLESQTHSSGDCSLAVSVPQCCVCACTSHHSTGCAVSHPERLQPCPCSGWPLPHRDTDCISSSPDLATVPACVAHGAKGPTCCPQSWHFKGLLLKASQGASDTVNPPFLGHDLSSPFNISFFNCETSPPYV